jgi:hypothetical protein
MILLFSSNAYAVFITITAAGGVTSAQNSSVTVGTSIAYTFTFELNSDGYTINKESKVDYKLDNTKMDYFYCDFNSQYVLQDYNMQPYVIENNYGFKYSDGSGCYLFGGSGTHLVRLSLPSQVGQLTTGCTIYGLEASKRNDSKFEQIKATLELKSISINVPEPSMFSLIGFAFLIFLITICKVRISKM